jgi:hypothetical protein
MTASRTEDKEKAEIPKKAKSLFENPPGEGTGPTKMAKLGDFL